jgi:hypothetical protein
MDRDLFHHSLRENEDMRRYVIERDLPGAGNLTSGQLQHIAQTSNAVLREMGPAIQWEQSYVTGNRIYCVYRAESDELIREHAKRGGFPCTNVSEVEAVIDPLTASLQTA